MTPADADKFATSTCQADDGTELRYHVYPPEQATFERVIVYIHGLVSDLSWFQIPSNLPPGTGLLFLPRQPREHVQRFEIWRDHYECCIKDFKAHHKCRYLHLVAQCFGTMPGLHLAITRPETFSTITLACPPVELRHEFSLRKKLGILFGSSDSDVFSELTPRSYGRSPELARFINQNPNVVWYFTNQFYRQTNRLRRWLKKYMITFPAPTHLIVATEDDVAEPVPLQISGGEMPDRTTVIQSDHFCELLPARQKFWESTFEFQLQSEPKYQVDGAIETVLVTGATGFVGHSIVRQLDCAGRKVIAFARNPQVAEQQFGDLDNVEVRAGTLFDIESIATALQGVDAVAHVAGHVSDWDTYESFERVNVRGTQNMLFLAHECGVKQFVHVSSLGVFGDTDQDNIDENNMYFLSSDYYSNSKIYAEIAVRKYCRSYGIPFSIVRPGFVYGDEDKKFMPRLVQRLQQNKVSYVGSTENFLNTVYIGNVAELINAIVGNVESFGQTYNLADPQATTVKQFMDRVCDGLNLPQPSKVLSKPFVLGLATMLETVFRGLRIKKAPPVTRKQVTFVARSRSVNATKAYQLIGRQPYSFDEGIERTIASFRQSST